MQSKELREWKKWEVNSKPQSEDTLRGMPCFANTWVTKASATSTKVALSVVGMKIPSLERWSMTTKIDVKPFDGGSCSMKSMLIECHGLSGIGSGCRRPYG